VFLWRFVFLEYKKFNESGGGIEYMDRGVVSEVTSMGQLELNFNVRSAPSK
jgi:hypothetical protein